MGYYKLFSSILVQWWDDSASLSYLRGPQSPKTFGNKWVILLHQTECPTMPCKKQWDYRTSYQGSCRARPFGFLLTGRFYSSVGREVSLQRPGSRRSDSCQRNARIPCSLQNKWIFSSRDVFGFCQMEKMAPNTHTPHRHCSLLLCRIINSFISIGKFISAEFFDCLTVGILSSKSPLGQS